MRLNIGEWNRTGRRCYTSIIPGAGERSRLLLSEVMCSLERRRESWVWMLTTSRSVLFVIQPNSWKHEICAAVVGNKINIITFLPQGYIRIQYSSQISPDPHSHSAALQAGARKVNRIQPMPHTENRAMLHIAITTAAIRMLHHQCKLGLRAKWANSQQQMLKKTIKVEQYK